MIVVNDLALFLGGVAVTIPTAIAIVALIYAAIQDGRDNDFSQAQLRADQERHNDDAAA